MGKIVPKLHLLTPAVFLPVMLAFFYFAGLAFVRFSVAALVAVVIGLATYGLAIFAINKGVFSKARAVLDEGVNYFQALLVATVIVFTADLLLKSYVPFLPRLLIYLVVGLAIAFKFSGLQIPGLVQVIAGGGMIVLYAAPAFLEFGLYGVYMNRTGGLMPPFLMGMGTMVLVNGLLSILADGNKKTFAVAVPILAVVGPLMAALVGYRAYAIFYFLPAVCLYLLRYLSLDKLKAGLLALVVVAAAFAYTYFATSFVRGGIYAYVPLDGPNVPKAVMQSLEEGSYNYVDMTLAKSERIFTRPLFTYRIFVEVVEKFYPWGTSRGRLLASLFPGANTGRQVTIEVLGRPFTASFLGIPFIEFGLPGVIVWMILSAVVLLTISRLPDLKLQALTLSILMIWLDTGPAVWWHWLPFISAFFYLSRLRAASAPSRLSPQQS